MRDNWEGRARSREMDGLVHRPNRSFPARRFLLSYRPSQHSTFLGRTLHPLCVFFPPSSSLPIHTGENHSVIHQTNMCRAEDSQSWPGWRPDKTLNILLRFVLEREGFKYSLPKNGLVEFACFTELDHTAHL